MNTGLTPQQQAVSDMMPKLPRVSVPLSDVCVCMVGVLWNRRARDFEEEAKS